MSLIQDALKRKREEEATPLTKEAPTTAPPVVETKPLVTAPPNIEEKPNKLLTILTLIIITALATIGIIKFNRAPAAETKIERKAEQKPEPKPEPPQAIEKRPPVALAVAPALPSPIEKPVKKIEKKNWPELTLTGFATGNGQRMVYINGKMLAEGRKIKGARILRIGKTEAIIEYQGERRILRLDPQ